jgi:hypothetical protein
MTHRPQAGGQLGQRRGRGQHGRTEQHTRQTDVVGDNVTAALQHDSGDRRDRGGEAKRHCRPDSTGLHGSGRLLGHRGAVSARLLLAVGGLARLVPGQRPSRPLQQHQPSTHTIRISTGAGVSRAVISVAGI